MLADDEADEKVIFRFIAPNEVGSRKFLIRTNN
jgi:hypothetical protein